MIASKDVAAIWMLRGDDGLRRRSVSSTSAIAFVTEASRVYSDLPSLPTTPARAGCSSTTRPRDGDTVLAEYAASRGGGGRSGRRDRAVPDTLNRPPTTTEGRSPSARTVTSTWAWVMGERPTTSFGHGQNDRTPLAALLRFDVSVPGILVICAREPLPGPRGVGDRPPQPVALHDRSTPRV